MDAQNFPHFYVSFVIFFFLFSSALCYASHFITSTQSLSGTRKLTSNGGTFELGFFQPGNGTSPYYYIGIWYSLTKVSQFTPIWVANRDTPISDHTKTELRISSDGNLVLSNWSNPLIWSTNVTIQSKSTIAVLLDSGNLVLRDGSNPKITLWQSFDHPTHTWLPGGKLGLNKVTGEVQRMISWKNRLDPAPGIFSHEIDPNGSQQYFELWNNTRIYWSSGVWNGQTFNSVPEMAANYIFDTQYVNNATENYFAYYLKSGIAPLTMLILDVTGQLKELTWEEEKQEWILYYIQPHLQCEVYALCGPFGSCTENALPFCNCITGFREKSLFAWSSGDWSGGCVRNTPLQCGQDSSGKLEKDRFYTMSNMRLPADNAHTLQVGSASDCENGCLNNCSCIAYSYNYSGCSVWYGDLLNLQEQYTGSGEGTLFLRLAASEFQDSKSNNGAVIRAVIGGVAGSLALGLIIWLIIKRKRSRMVICKSKLVEGVSIAFRLIWRKIIRLMMSQSKVVEVGLIAFRFSDLQHMTKNFSEKLGGGAFGSVFKGVLRDSTAVAVKKLEGLQQGEKQFRTEVSTIGTVQHVNLIHLHGFCSEGDQKLLVYEYMPNGSLDSLLFPNDDSNKVLDWKTRYQIAVGIARGLTYLHEQCRDSIIHCDIKPENILLDACFVPKVADFGLAKLMGHDFSRVLTTVRGTMGYLAPEWISGVAITAKSDVYSYGMMLFEIVSGERNWKQINEQNNTFFPIFAARKLIEGDVKILVDHRLEDDAELEEVVRACKVACWCIQDDENCRPTMGQVVQILEGVLEADLPAIPRALQILVENPGTTALVSELPMVLGVNLKTSSLTSSSRD